MRNYLDTKFKDKSKLDSGYEGNLERAVSNTAPVGVELEAIDPLRARIYLTTMVAIETHDDLCPFCRGLHWHKYKYLEEKLIDISNYVTIDDRNNSAWGEEIADLLVLLGNEMDTFFKDMYDCPNFSDSVTKDKHKIKITDYQKIYEPYYELSKNSVEFSFGLGKDQSLSPFSDFEKDVPVWWSAYNHIKHEYYSSIEEANLGNVLNALGGLLILNSLHLCSKSYLIFAGEIKHIKDYKSQPDYFCDGLLRSKLGTTLWGRSLCVQTRIFNFYYRTDESINHTDELILPFIKKGKTSSMW